MSKVRDNKTKSRFELDVDGEIAFANYRLVPSAVVITHTETPRELRGQGVASELVRGALELIRADGGLFEQAPRIFGFGGVSNAWQPILKLVVVPAHAGTHTPCRVF